MSSRTSTEQFQHDLEQIEARLKSIGKSITDACDAVGCSRATPSRWKKHAPNTLRIMDQLQAYVAEQEAIARVAEEGGATGDEAEAVEESHVE